MRSTPRMPEQIKAGFYPGFERAWRRAEIAGRFVMLAVVAATVAGLLGGGPVNFWTRTVVAGSVQVEYSPVVRFGTPAGLTVHVAADQAQDRVAVSFPAAIVKRYALQTVFPQPLQWTANGAGDVRMVFSVTPGAHEAVVQVGGMPAGGGLMRLSAWADGQAPATWSQLVLP